MSGQIEIGMICHIDNRCFRCLCLHAHMQTIVFGQCIFYRCGNLARISFMTSRRTVLQCHPIAIRFKHLPMHFIKTKKTAMQLMSIVKISRYLNILTIQHKMTISNTIANTTNCGAKIGICCGLISYKRNLKVKQQRNFITLHINAAAVTKIFSFPSLSLSLSQSLWLISPLLLL